MGSYSFKLPDLGEGIVESEISEWHVKPGDTVEEDQHIADVMTDKAVVEVSSPVSGKVISLACEAGEVLAVGKELARFEVEGEGNRSAGADVERAAVVAEAAPEPQAASAADNAAAALESNQSPEASNKHTDSAAATGSVVAKKPTAPGFAGQILASPSVRQRARDAKINLSVVPGSGPAGRISNSDLDAFIAAGGELAIHGRGSMRTPRYGSTELKIKGLRRVIAQKMQQAKRNIPHYSYIEEVDVSNLEELRQHLNQNRLDEQPKLTLLPFMMQALVKVLPGFPHCNARFDDEAGLLTQLEAVHIGIATMTDNGLLVPVVRYCESLDIWQSAAELARVAQAARDGSAQKEELSGSTITVTSLGAIGGIATTPVINAPETAIIGVNKIQERPVVKEGVIVVRKMMNISSSFDHRIVDGFDGAQLVQALKSLLENPGAIFV